MWNPAQRSEFWHSAGVVKLALGPNVLELGPNDAESYMTCAATSTRNRHA